MVTSNTCLPLEAIVSGTVAYSVNEAPVLALASSIPMWRELRPGDRGADVEALQSALAALGTGVQVDGVLGHDTLEVIAGFYLEAGYSLETLDSLPSSRLLWLPTPSVVPTTCAMNVGDKLAGSTDFATVSGGLASAQIAYPSNFVPGPRVLLVNDKVLEIDAHGAVSNADLQLISGIPGYQDAIRTTEPVPLTGVWSLAEPARAVSVPAAALSHIEGQEACIWNGSEGYAVTLLGSQLGQSIVKSATDTDLPSTVTINPKNIQAEC
ncbi:hypothetical protein [Leucobacter sp. NPDC077196]|uniref:peptidoglycan-binding domain-containing protein n=1 Tax=Leucobacter sp. NPDC077196 TaxID=3154959 RepID=UPI00343AFB18